MAQKNQCVISSKKIEYGFVIATVFCGKSQKYIKGEGEKDSYAELPSDAAEKARNANACAKCVSAIEKLTRIDR